MSDECDPACVKIIIDTGMGAEAAKLYADVMGGAELFTATALFYAGVAENVIQPAARALNMLHLTEDQQDRLNEQINLQCYPRADYLLKWAKASVAERTQKSEQWTAKLFEWVADDQKFFIDLAAEVGERGAQVSERSA